MGRWARSLRPRPSAAGTQSSIVGSECGPIPPTRKSVPPRRGQARPGGGSRTPSQFPAPASAPLHTHLTLGSHARPGAPAHCSRRDKAALVPRPLGAGGVSPPQGLCPPPSPTPSPSQESQKRKHLGSRTPYSLQPPQTPPNTLCCSPQRGSGGRAQPGTPPDPGGSLSDPSVQICAIGLLRCWGWPDREGWVWSRLLVNGELACPQVLPPL